MSPALAKATTCASLVRNRAHGYGPARIDPGFDPAMKAAFEGLGLADMLH